MRVWKNEAEYDLGPSVVALGMFDGVHIGHQALIFRALALAGEENAACVIHTFDRHPMCVFAPEQAPRQLLTLEQRLEKFRALGVDGVLVQPFTPAFAATAPEDFLEGLARRLQPKAIVAGFNYSFGAHGRGDAALLCSEAARLGFRAEILEPVVEAGETVSSTRIRRLQDAGALEQAQHLLQLRMR